jgi:hypothetical protein
MLDLRIPTGWFFLIIGAILVAMGVFAPGERAALTESNVNLYCGAVMLAFSGFMLALSRMGAKKTHDREPRPVRRRHEVHVSRRGGVSLIGEHTDYNLGFRASGGAGWQHIARLIQDGRLRGAPKPARREFRAATVRGSG